MYFQIETVLEKYGLEESTLSKGRQILLCEREQELYALKEYQGTEKKAEFMRMLGCQLKEQGIQTDGLVPALDGSCCVEGIDGVRYTLHHWYRGRECDLKNRMEILLAVSWLARFHKACRSFAGQEEIRIESEAPFSEYERHKRELKKIYQFIRTRKKKSDFELLYMRCFSDFFSQCQDVCEKGKQHTAQYPVEPTAICHGDFHFHNVLFVFGKPVFLNFTHAGYGMQIFDLCTFMRKVLEKYNWDGRLGIEILQEYHRVNPISAASFWQMYYRMAFPEKFWKLANRYYTSNKAWISGQDYKKLETEWKQMPFRKRYLDQILSFSEYMDGKFS